jgi:hypothetical protein
LDGATQRRPAIGSGVIVAIWVRRFLDGHDNTFHITLVCPCGEACFDAPSGDLFTIRDVWFCNALHFIHISLGIFARIFDLFFKLTNRQFLLSYLIDAGFVSQEDYHVSRFDPGSICARPEGAAGT